MMRKFILLPSLFQHCPKSLISLRFCSSTNAKKNSVLVDYLMGSLKFSEAKALSISTRFVRIKSLQKIELVVLYFKSLGLSDPQIQSVAHVLPSILFANIQKTLKPKVDFFQQLGLSGPCLVAFISKNPTTLSFSMDRSLKPCLLLIREVLKNDGRNKSDEKISHVLFRTLTRCGRLVQPNSRLKENILYLESCGIVGSQLSALLSKQPRIFSMRKEKLQRLVCRALDMGFAIGSKMLVHGVHCLSCLSVKTLTGRFEVARICGFSDDEVALMFRRTPFAFSLSEENLRRKFELFLNDLEFDKSVLVKHPILITYSVEERVIPRFKVVEILKSRGMCRKDLSFYSAMCAPESQFLENYIFRFKNDAGELLSAYNDHRQHPDTCGCGS